MDKTISKTQFDGFLRAYRTMATDYLRMHRIAGFAQLEEVDKKETSEVMNRINDRIAMIEAAEKPEA